MTLTQRRVRAVDPSRPGDKGTTEPGIKYTCDACHVDITHSVRIKCAHKECDEIDLCVPCFMEGKELQKHEAWHAYKVVEQHSYPIFSSDWGADEELLLVSGLMKDGLGNWQEAATHIGTRTKEDCETHYNAVYLGVGPDGKELDHVWENTQEDGQGHVDGPPRKKRRRDFMPPMDMDIKVDYGAFQENKRERIEELRKPQAIPPAPTAPLVSAPTNHEVAGFMPGRLEFEHEVDNEAEIPVKDMEFGLVYKYGGDQQPAAKPAEIKPAEEEEEEAEEEVKEEEEEEDDEKPLAKANGTAGGKKKGKEKSKAKEKEKEKDEEEEEAPGEDVVEDEDELEVKLALMEIYFSKLDKREEAKDLIFDRCLTDYKKIQAIERKRPKEEREMVQRFKVFAKLQTAQDYEVLIEGLLYEQNLRKRITELQEYRRMGVTTAQEADAYETAKAARAGYRPLIPRMDVLPTGARANAGQHRFLHGTGTPTSKHGDSREVTPRLPGQPGRKPPTPLNLSNAASLDLLSSDEQQLCSSLRILPRPYLAMKDTFFRENERRRGFLKRRDARKFFKMDVNKSGRVFDFLVNSGMLVLQHGPMAKSPEMESSMVLGIDIERPSLSEVRVNGTM